MRQAAAFVEPVPSELQQPCSNVRFIDACVRFRLFYVNFSKLYVSFIVVERNIQSVNNGTCGLMFNLRLFV